MIYMYDNENNTKDRLVGGLIMGLLIVLIYAIVELVKWMIK